MFLVRALLATGEKVALNVVAPESWQAYNLIEEIMEQPEHPRLMWAQEIPDELLTQLVPDAVPLRS